MQIIQAGLQDAARLALLNKRLIEDEQSDNPMSVAELEGRMRGFLGGEYHAYLFSEGGETVGYALVRHTSTPLYLRQFYIDRGFRRRHYGQTAFRLLMKRLQADAIDIDVLPWNEAGRLFWKSCGFQETCVSMRHKA